MTPHRPASLSSAKEDLPRSLSPHTFPTTDFSQRATPTTKEGCSPCRREKKRLFYTEIGTSSRDSISPSSIQKFIFAPPSKFRVDGENTALSTTVSTVLLVCGLQYLPTTFHTFIANFVNQTLQLARLQRKFAEGLRPRRTSMQRLLRLTCGAEVRRRERIRLCCFRSTE